MCGCPAHGCLEAIPSGGEYKSTVSASRAYSRVKRGSLFGQMIISERAERVLSVDCVEKCSPAQSKES